MNLKLYIYALFIAIAALSCGKGLFTLEMKLTGNENASYTMKYYAADKKRGMMMETNVTLQGGIAAAECPCVRPALVWVMSGPQVLTCFYAEKGDRITIEGETSSPITWKIGGNKINEQLTEWRTENSDALKGANTAKINKAVEAYVSKNPDEKLSTLLMLTTFDRSADEQLYARLWNMLSDKAKDKKLLEAIGRSDQPKSVLNSPSAIVGPLTLQDITDSVVTIKPTDFDATLLYFWIGNEGTRSADFDSIKALAKHYASNDNLRIADISTGNDSIGWKNMARHDSIVPDTRWSRLWAPGGTMYRGIVHLELGAIPCFIIVDRNGSQKYRGSSAADAMKAVRRLAGKAAEPKKDTVKH